MRAYCGRPSPSNRLFSFGIISDVQYADIPDGLSFNKIPRYYRASLHSLQRAITSWQRSDADFCIHLGDIVDGFNPPELAEAALDAVISEFDRLGKPHYHMIGNHCLYHIPRKVLNSKLNMAGPEGVEGPSYYSFCPHPDWRLVVLDGYDVSLLGWPAGHPLHEQAKQVLDERNPNKDKNNPTRPPHLPATERRFVKFGGGLSTAQIEWFKDQLTCTRQSQQRALIFCHLALHPATCVGTCLLWNYEAVLELIHSFRDVCVATFAGHTHKDGDTVDEDGVYHRVLKGVVETPPDQECCGLVQVTDDSLEMIGSGVQSVNLPLKQWPKSNPLGANAHSSPANDLVREVL